MAERAARPRVLLVEDSFIVAESLRSICENAGMEVIGPALSMRSALELLDELTSLHAAIVDLDLNGEASLPVLDCLIARAVPILLTTGYDVRFFRAATACSPVARNRPRRRTSSRKCAHSSAQATVRPRHDAFHGMPRSGRWRSTLRRAAKTAL